MDTSPHKSDFVNVNGIRLFLDCLHIDQAILVQHSNEGYVTPFMTKEQQAQMMEFFDTVLLPWTRRYIEQFRRDVPHAKIVELPHSHTYCFITQEELVYNEMSMFLLDC